MNGSTGTPSWASTQRQTGQYRPPTGDNSFDPRQQQSGGGGGGLGGVMDSSPSLGRMPSRGRDQQQQQWPSSSSGNDTQSHRASSYQPMQQNGGSQRMAAQQDSHRRTQSLRPFSAFQPLDQADPYGPSQKSPGTPNDRPPSPTGSTSRSIRTSAAPLTFKSPELRSALYLQDAQQRKTYMEGYLSRRDALGADGKPLHPNDPKKAWHLCFVQLSGTVLSVWSVSQMEEAAREGREVPPTYINVTDSFVDLIGNLIEDPNEVPGSRGRYENVFALNSAGNNRILFCVEGAVGRRLVQAWVNGIRLASWEKVRLEEIYTGALIRARLGSVGANSTDTGPMQGPPPAMANLTIASPVSKGKMEGWVKARFMGSTEWKKCWLVLSKDKNEASSGQSVTRRFWNKIGGAGDRSSILSMASTSDKDPTAPTTPGRTLSNTGEGLAMEPPPGSNNAPGIAQFYTSKKDKKPFATMLFAAHAFAVYPSRPELVEGSSLFKVEGAFPLSQVLSATHRIRQTGWVMIMPELEAGSRGANAEMMKWVIGFMDSFQLYGRPEGFNWDARSPKSAFFAYPIGQYKERLFLDRELAEFLDVREERHLATRTNLHGIMAARMRGERTPLLPPLPQPNTAHTRQLNGGKSGPQQQQLSADQAATSEPTSPLPEATGGPDDDDDQQPQRSSGLEPIGERSREGSQMTLAAAQQHQDRSQQGSATSAKDSDLPYRSTDSQQQQQQQPSRYAGAAAPALAAGALAGSAAASQRDERASSSLEGPRRPFTAERQDSYRTAPAAATPPPPSVRSGVASIDRSDSLDSRTQSQQQQPQQQQPSYLAASRGAQGSSPADATPVPSPIKKDTSMSAAAPPIAAAAAIPSGSSAVPAPSGRGAEADKPATSSSMAVPSDKTRQRQSDADLASSYDEGALFYLRSMSDQQPPAPSKPTVQTQPSQLAAAAAASGAAGVAPMSATTKDSPGIDTPSSYTQQSSYAPSSRTANGLSRDPSVRIPQQDEDRLDEDALAAYSYLDQPPSPSALGRQRSLPKQATAAAPAPASYAAAPVQQQQQQQTQQTYAPTPTAANPSTFGQNKRAQERKEAAQAQAAAVAEARSKPGKAAGATKKGGLKPKGRHAWGEESSEDEEEEDEDDEEEEQRRQASQGSRMAPPVAQAMNSSSASGSQASSIARGMTGSSAAATASANGLPAPGMTPAGSTYSNSSGRQSPRYAESTAAPSTMPANNAGAGQGMMRAGQSHPALASTQQQRQSVLTPHLGAPYASEDDGRRSASPNTAASSTYPAARQQPQTFVQLNPDEQPGSMTTVFQPHGLLEAGAQDKQDRSAKQQELEARMAGVGLVNVPSKPPPPQAGLLGAISAHERERKGAGGLGATMTERERQRVEAERRQREEDAAQRQQQQQQMMMQQQQMAGMGGMLGMNPMMMGGGQFNPFLWQQMMMMNPMMMGGMPGQGSGESQLGGHGGSQQGSHGGQSPPPAMDPYQQQMMQMQMHQQQMAAAMAAQQAYMAAMSQSQQGGGPGSMMSGQGGDQQQPGMPGSPSQMSMSPSMLGMGGYGMPSHMSMYGMPPGGMMGGYPMMGGGSGSDFGGPASGGGHFQGASGGSMSGRPGSAHTGGSPQQSHAQQQSTGSRRFEGSAAQERPGQAGSPLRR
ncbi:hypothetical protein BDZ90DRAFT_277711 [Jaminaea rosea]|uniref:PH domain-containing protein n=1 Tax=Jaminaea rosea TaxID=1569628 RepID=A0A316UZT4_9BASI|nr:hypothetical protein BDZ90DRAFT_277711 [Jaminaea rosea]PWN29433.1 hypothetical protein BDZ90DRAFT_277711 [Jaminaea rosea]